MLFEKLLDLLFKKKRIIPKRKKTSNTEMMSIRVSPNCWELDREDVERMSKELREKGEKN